MSDFPLTAVGETFNSDSGVSRNAVTLDKEMHKCKREKRKQCDKESAKLNECEQEECEKLGAEIKAVTAERRRLVEELRKLSARCCTIQDQNKTLMREIVEMMHGSDAISDLAAAKSHHNVETHG